VTEKPIVTEGNTSDTGSHIAQRIGRQVRVFENTTVSTHWQLQRPGMTMAIPKQRSWGGGGNLCQYRQHTSASSMPNAGMRVFVLIPEGYVALGVSAGIALGQKCWQLRILTRR